MAVKWRKTPSSAQDTGEIETSVANPLPVQNSTVETNTNNRYAGGKTSVVATVTSTGDTTVHTPAAGDAIRLYWAYTINDPDESNSPLIKIKIGSTELYRAYAVAHWELFEGAADETLVVNLDQTGSVACTFHLEEFTP